MRQHEAWSLVRGQAQHPTRVALLPQFFQRASAQPQLSLSSGIPGADAEGPALCSRIGDTAEGPARLPALQSRLVWAPHRRHERGTSQGRRLHNAPGRLRARSCSPISNRGRLAELGGRFRIPKRACCICAAIHFAESPGTAHSQLPSFQVCKELRACYMAHRDTESGETCSA